MVPLENRVRMSGFISPQILPLFTEGVYFKDFESLTSGHGFLKGIKNIFDIHLLTTSYSYSYPCLCNLTI
jgi:hypothetical protein